MWIAGAIAAVFLVAGVSAMTWGGGGKLPTMATNMSPGTESPVTPRSSGGPIAKQPAPNADIDGR